VTRLEFDLCVLNSISHIHKYVLNCFSHMYDFQIWDINGRGMDWKDKSTLLTIPKELFNHLEVEELEKLIG
jgi:hypothetical protein